MGNLTALRPAGLNLFEDAVSQGQEHFRLSLEVTIDGTTVNTFDDCLIKMTDAGIFNDTTIAFVEFARKLSASRLDAATSAGCWVMERLESLVGDKYRGPIENECVAIPGHGLTGALLDYWSR